MGRNVAFSPRMVHDLLNSWSFVRFQSKHLLHEILELLREVSKTFRLVLTVGSPENIKSVCCDASVKWIDWLCCCERWMLGNHHEQDDGCSEDIDFLSLVRLV